MGTVVIVVVVVVPHGSFSFSVVRVVVVFVVWCGGRWWVYPGALSSSSCRLGEGVSSSAPKQMLPPPTLVT